MIFAKLSCITVLMLSISPLGRPLSYDKAQEDRAKNGEGEEAGHAPPEKIYASLHISRFLQDNFSVIKRLVGELINQVVRRDSLHRSFKVFDGHAGDRTEEER